MEKQVVVIYLAYFFVYSFLGWIWEILIALITTGKLLNKGFLYGPLCPIYGISVVCIVGLHNKFKKNILLLFLADALIITLVELVGGFLLEAIFHTRWWDYSDYPFNFHGYIAPEVSIIWGIFSILVIQVIHPFISSKMKPVSYHFLRPFLYVMVFLFALDMGFTVTKTYNLSDPLPAAFVPRRTDETGETGMERLFSQISAKYKNLRGSVKRDNAPEKNIGPFFLR
jgi:uncharacterized membrane protein